MPIALANLLIRTSLITAIYALPVAALGDTPEDICANTVIVGKVVHVTYEGSVDSWNGFWKLEIDVKRVLRGVEPRRHIVARAMAEAQIKQNTDFVFFLNTGRDGDYGVQSADLDLTRAKSQLTRCSDAPIR